MALPKRLARFNRRVTNRITGPFARSLPGFGVVVHTGRASGRSYRTPVNVFATTDGYVVALTYGADSDWVKNVLAAGGCELEHRGQRVRVTVGAVIRDDSGGQVPGPVRRILRGLGVAEYLELTRNEPPPSATP